jgi:prolyl 4-hydroxylase
VGLPLRNAESFQVIHYGPTQEYRAHFDAWEHGTERGNRCMAKYGQRLVTCLVYLNTVEDGGATGFPKLGVEVRPEPGKLVIFHNCHAGTVTRHPHSLHGGLPVIAGEKWAANLWFRENACR